MLKIWFAYALKIRFTYLFMKTRKRLLRISLFRYFLSIEFFRLAHFPNQTFAQKQPFLTEFCSLFSVKCLFFSTKSAQSFFIVKIELSYLFQTYFICKEEEKLNMLWSFITNHRRKKTLIFVTCCKQVRFLFTIIMSTRFRRAFTRSHWST